MTCGYYRTSSPVTALPMIMRWISDVPSKIVKVVEVRAVSAGRKPAERPLVSTNSARRRATRTGSWKLPPQAGKEIGVNSFNDAEGQDFAGRLGSGAHWCGADHFVIPAGGPVR
jgi:hypothetical protein